MFDAHTDREALRSTDPAEPSQNEFAQRCREPAELWALQRRRCRPQPIRNNLPRVVSP